MNERIIELVDIAPKEFWGDQDAHLETIKKYYPKLKIVARGTTLKAFGEKEVLDEFERQYNVKIDAKTIKQDELFSGKFTHNDINIALQSITQPLQLRYKKVNKTIILTRE